jgi:putative NADPH-quinone reductase
MSVLVLNGSPHKKGSTATILRSVAHGVSVTHEVIWVDVYDLEIKPCRGCLRCRPDGECVLPEDDGQRLGRQMGEADALVVGTPTHWGNMSAPLKTLLDRNVPVFEYVGEGLPKPMQKGKLAVIVTASRAPWPYNLLPSQGRGAIRAVRTVLRAGGYRIVGTINVPNVGPGRAVPARALARAERLGRRL